MPDLVLFLFHEYITLGNHYDSHFHPLTGRKKQTDIVHDGPSRVHSCKLNIKIRLEQRARP
jgi:hypothetical protein